MTETVSIPSPGSGTEAEAEPGPAREAGGGTAAGAADETTDETTDQAADGPADDPADEPADEPGPAELPDPATASSPAEAFDLLYARHATSLFRQAFLLTGDRRLAERSAAHAFRVAWERWPEVAVDRDPVGWVRAAAYEYALSPWHRLLPRRRAHGRNGPGRDGTRERETGEDGGARDRELPLEALLNLPPSYRRTLLLHDGLGLGLAETAAESEASTPATAGRLMHAREALAEHVPELSRAAPNRRREIVHSLLEGLADAQPAPEAAPARAVRSGSERYVRRRTGAAVGLTALVAATAALTAAVGPEGNAPPEKAPAVSVHSTDRDAAEDRAAG